LHYRRLPGIRQGHSRVYSLTIQQCQSSEGDQSMPLDESREGRIAVNGGEIWYRIVGRDGGVPLLTLHGGPGGGHDYLEPLEGLAGERPVVFYDQLGCGRADQPDDRSLWHINRFVQEVDEVRDALGLDRVHLLGQSWGGWLAIEYMLGKPDGIVSLTLASTSASTAEFVREANRLIDELPPDMRDALRRGEREQNFDSPEYLSAMEEFYRRHVCRLDPWPDAVLRTAANLDGNPVYLTMNGPNEFTVIGNLKDWDRTARLNEIRVPTLITVGRYDEITPNCAETLHAGIAGSEIRVFERSGHCAHLEEPDEYLALLSDFLRRAEA
jgi:proline-specific peptidase